MTAEMIEWTLVLLEWIKGRVLESWPEAKLRGSVSEFDPDGYSIRFRENGDEYWMVVGHEVIQLATVGQVTELFQKEDWIAHMKRTGCIHVGLPEEGTGKPALNPCPYTRK